jgi:hypothetical protein
LLRQELMIGERVEIYLVKPGKEDVPPGGFLADGAIVFMSGGTRAQRSARPGGNYPRYRLRAEKLVFTCVPRFPNTKHPWGPVAQLIERVVRNDEVSGLIPLRSTTSFSWTCTAGRRKTTAD